VRHRSRIVGALILCLLAGLPAIAAQPASVGASVGADVSATVTGLRSSKGRVLACLTAHAAAFPDCKRDSTAYVARAPAGARVELDFGAVPPGRYAISLFHDENDNGHLDTRLMMPREGYGFSRDAPVRFGPPPFASAAFAVGSDGQRQTIRMRYLF
jgi:uncharacterized protein (DUF2141 family)